MMFILCPKAAIFTRSKIEVSISEEACLYCFHSMTCQHGKMEEECLNLEGIRCEIGRVFLFVESLPKAMILAIPDDGVQIT